MKTKWKIIVLSVLGVGIASVQTGCVPAEKQRQTEMELQLAQAEIAKLEDHAAENRARVTKLQNEVVDALEKVDDLAGKLAESEAGREEAKAISAEAANRMKMFEAEIKALGDENVSLKALAAKLEVQLMEARAQLPDANTQ